MEGIRSLVDWIGRQPLSVKLWSSRRLTIYGTQAPGAGAGNIPHIAINSREHIARFEPTVSWLDRDTFIDEAERRIAAGVLVFTYCPPGGPLAGYGYAQPDAVDTTYTFVDQRVVWPEGTATLYGGYVHPDYRGKGVHRKLQQARIAHLVGERGMKWVVSGVTHDNAAAHASAQRAGLRPLAELETRRKFGLAKKSHRRVDTGFPMKIADNG